MRPLAALVGCLLLVGGCTGGAGDGNETTVEERGHELEDVPLRPNEAPEGLRERERGTGPVNGLREVLPPRRTAPGLPPVPPDLRRTFRAGYQRLFAGGGGSATSSALQFVDAASAARFFQLLSDVHDVTVADEGLLPAAGLGEESYAWEHVVPGAQSAGAAWRRGDMVITVSLSGRVGEITVEVVLALARRVDGRLG